jgi:hypothetical protein
VRADQKQNHNGTSALIPAFSPGEKVENSAPFWGCVTLNLVDGYSKNRKQSMLFLLPGEKVRLRAVNKTDFIFERQSLFFHYG